MIEILQNTLRGKALLRWGKGYRTRVSYPFGPAGAPAYHIDDNLLVHVEKLLAPTTFTIICFTDPMDYGKLNPVFQTRFGSMGRDMTAVLFSGVHIVSGDSLHVEIIASATNFTTPTTLYAFASLTPGIAPNWIGEHPTYTVVS